MILPAREGRGAVFSTLLRSTPFYECQLPSPCKTIEHLARFGAVANR
jgi:hypothetical protein